MNQKDKEWLTNVVERLAEESQNPESLWWLSFVDKHKPAGERFLGVIITKAKGFSHAIQKTWLLNINPGGEVIGYECEEIPEEFHDRLLSKTVLKKYDLIE